MTKRLENDIISLYRGYGKKLVVNKIDEILAKCGNLYEMESGSVLLIVRVENQDGLDCLWSRYTEGDLAKELTEIFITDELTPEDKTDLSIQVTIPDSDFEQAYRFFEELETTKHEGKTWL